MHISIISTVRMWNAGCEIEWNGRITANAKRKKKYLFNLWEDFRAQFGRPKSLYWYNHGRARNREPRGTSQTSLTKKKRTQSFPMQVQIFNGCSMQYCEQSVAFDLCYTPHTLADCPVTVSFPPVGLKREKVRSGRCSEEEKHNLSSPLLLTNYFSFIPLNYKLV